ncbi:MAG: Fic family protein [candidate division WOR-3 bacterium]
MFKPIFTLTPSVVDNLLAIERVRGFLEALTMREHILAEMQAEALIRDVHASTHIEGTQLTLEETRAILEGKEVEGASKRDVKEVINYRKALDFAAEHLNSPEAITEDLIKELHAIVTDGFPEARPGQYRKVQNYIISSETNEVIYTPPPHYEVPYMMKDMVEWLNTQEELSPILVSGVAQFQLVHIHPFVDGNGRTARVLATLILYKTGYDFKRLFALSEYYDRDRKRYYRALQLVRKYDMDMTPWLEYFTEGLRSQLLEVRKRGLEFIRDSIVAEHLSGFHLNERQKTCIRYLEERGHITRSEYAELTGASLRTANYDLRELEDAGLVKRVGAGRSTRYILNL